MPGLPPVLERIRATSKGHQKKYCGRCSHWRDLENFHKSSASKDGYQAWCIDCAKKARTVRTRKLFPNFVKAENTNTKRCGSCKKIKGRGCFHLSARAKDGLQLWCIKCTRAARLASYHRLKGKSN